MAGIADGSAWIARLCADRKPFGYRYSGTESGGRLMPPGWRRSTGRSRSSDRSPIRCAIRIGCWSGELPRACRSLSRSAWRTARLKCCNSLSSRPLPTASVFSGVAVRSGGICTRYGRLPTPSFNWKDPGRYLRLLTPPGPSPNPADQGPGRAVVLQTPPSSQAPGGGALVGAFGRAWGNYFARLLAWGGEAGRGQADAEWTNREDRPPRRSERPDR